MAIVPVFCFLPLSIPRLSASSKIASVSISSFKYVWAKHWFVIRDLRFRLLFPSVLFVLVSVFLLFYSSWESLPGL